MRQIYPSATDALDGALLDRMTIAACGFRLCGIPERLIDELVASGVEDLTMASNNAEIDREDFGDLSADALSVNKLPYPWVGSPPACPSNGGDRCRRTCD